MKSKKEFNWKKYGTHQFRDLDRLWEVAALTLETRKLCEALSEHPLSSRWVADLVKAHIRNAASLCRRVSKPGVPASGLDLSLVDARPYVRSAVALSPNSRDRHIAKLLSGTEVEIVTRFVANTKSVARLMPRPAFLELLTTDVNTRMGLASNPATPGWILCELATLKSMSVLHSLGSNPSLPVELFDRVVLTVGSFRGEVIRNPALPERWLRHLANSEWSSTRSQVAYRHDCPRDILAVLCLDPAPSVRAVASNNLKELLGAVRLTEWCTVNLGLSSPRVTKLTARVVERYSPVGWFVALSDFLRRIYSNRPSDFLDMLERLACKRVAVNAARCSSALLECELLCFAFSFLSKEAMERLFKTRWPVKVLHEWHLLSYSAAGFLARIRSRLETLECDPQSMREYLDTLSSLILEERKKVDLLFGLSTRSLEKAPFLETLADAPSLAGYEVAIPKGTNDLMELGIAMGSCLREPDTVRKIALGPTSVFVLQDKKSVARKFVVEVNSHGKIRELKGRFNKAAPAGVRLRVERALRHAEKAHTAVTEGSVPGL